MVRAASPSTAILFVTNNDTYFRKKIVNPNAGPVRNDQLCTKYGFGNVDFFNIMAGYGSMGTWTKTGLPHQTAFTLRALDIHSWAI